MVIRVSYLQFWKRFGLKNTTVPVYYRHTVPYHGPSIFFLPVNQAGSKILKEFLYILLKNCGGVI
jgi:hypothetical protein